MSDTDEQKTTPDYAKEITSCLREYLLSYAAEKAAGAAHKKTKEHLAEVILYAKQLMEDEDIPSMVVVNPDTGEKRNCFLHKITKANTRAGMANTPELFDALRQVGLEDLIKDSVNAKSLESAIKEQFMDDTDAIVLPPELEEIINVFEDFTVRSRKG